jgi:hypothetical protein
MKVRANGGDVTFDAGTDPTGQQRWGDSVSVSLSEPNNSIAVWTLDVYMQGTQGRYFLDQVVTVPPTAGGRANRIVAIARCPGALHWFVFARCLNDPTAEAEIMIEASREGSGGSAGVYAPIAAQPIGNLQGPAPALAADATANPSVSKIGTYMMALNGNATWDRLRSGLLGIYAQMVGWLNVLPGVRYLAGPPVMNPGEVTNLQGDSRGSVKVTDTASDGTTRNFPDAAPSADATLNISATRIGAFASAINGAGTWDRIRSGILAKVASVVGWVNVLPGVHYLAADETFANGEVGAARCNSKGAARVVETDVETVVFDLSGNSPANTNPVAGVGTWATITDLAKFRTFVLHTVLAGVDGDGNAGGTIDMILQCSHDTTDGTNGTWVDWWRSTQVLTGAVAVRKRVNFALDNMNTTVGEGIPANTAAIVLGAAATSGGHPGKAVRVCWVPGAGVNNAIAQTIKLICTGPRA